MGTCGRGRDSHRKPGVKQVAGTPRRVHVPCVLLMLLGLLLLGLLPQLLLVKLLLVGLGVRSSGREGVVAGWRCQLAGTGTGKQTADLKPGQCTWKCPAVAALIHEAEPFAVREADTLAAAPLRGECGIFGQSRGVAGLPLPPEPRGPWRGSALHGDRAKGPVATQPPMLRLGNASLSGPSDAKSQSSCRSFSSERKVA